MSNIRYYNQAAPFWDWVSDMERIFNNGQRPPWFGDNGEGPSQGDRPGNQESSHGNDQGDVPPPGYDNEKTPEGEPFDGHHPPPPPGPAEEPSFPPGSGSPPHGHRDRHVHHGCEARGRHQHRGPPCGPGSGFRGRRGPHFGPRGCGRSGAASGFPPFAAAHAGGWNMDGLAQYLRDNLGLDLGGGRGRAGADAGADFRPPVDVFDAPDAFFVHVALAGARKEDLGVSWDAERSELRVAGVVHRPGDEDFLKTLAMGEREVGPFERRVRLGSRASPAAVDADAIGARMEDGVLLVRVPKVEEFVEVKKVDVE